MEKLFEKSRWYQKLQPYFSEISIFAAYEHTFLFVTKHDDVFIIPDKRVRAEKIDNLCKKRITFVHITDTNCYALSRDGQVFVWGDNSNFTCGKKEWKRNDPILPINQLHDIKSLACREHVMALSQYGELYCWV